jgi:hypothetical protein
MGRSNPYFNIWYKLGGDENIKTAIFWQML